MIRCTLRLFAVLVLFGASMPLAARPYTVEDLLRTEGFGSVTFGPHGRWLVFERLEPFLEMSRFDMLPHERLLRSGLYRVDLRRPWRAVPLLADPRPGVISYGFSTDGTRLAVGRFSGNRWELGIVTMATGAVRWLPLTPDYNPFYTTVQWISATRLVAIVEPDRALPWWLRRNGYAAETLPRRWKATRTGSAAAVTVIGSGHFINAGLPAPVNTLMMIDASSGRSRKLATGRFLTMTMAPDRGHIALIERGAAVHPPQGRPLRLVDRPYRETPAIYDLRRDRLWRLCRDCDVLGDVAWAGEGDRLAFYARRGDQDWSSAGMVETDVDRHSMTEVRAPGIAPVVTEGVDGSSNPAFHWLGRRLLLLARPANDPNGRADWYSVQHGAPVSLTSKLARVGTDMTTIEGCQAALHTDDGIWCLDGSAPKRLFGPGTRISNGWMIGWRRAADRITITGDVLQARAVTIEPDSKVDGLTASPDGKILLLRQVTSDGEKTLTLISRTQFGAIARVNQRLRDVAPARAVPVTSRSNGVQMTSWLFLPPKTVTGRKLATVVIPYPGTTFGNEPPADQQLGTSRFYANAQLLAAHGYAVLLPSLSATDKPPSGVFPYAAALDPIVDAAIATGYVDPDRIGLWGHSYGGYTVALITSQSRRYKAVVAQAGVYDLGAVPGTLMPQTQLAPQHGLFIGENFAYVETGQGRMGEPPWSAPMRYVRNSPVYRADKITTPMMIVATDQDVSPLPQAEQLFSALFRQDKDAELVTYWGEGHVVGSPYNLRDLYRRVFTWFDRFLGSPESVSVRPAQLASTDHSRHVPNARR